MPPFATTESSALVEYSDKLEGGAVKVSRSPRYGVNDFRAIKPLGSGDMGNVFLVALRSTNTPYAMKVMKKDVLKKRENTHRAVAEREILKSVNHPFLPSLHSHFETDSHMFLVMNYCHAGDLNVLRQKQPDRRFSESACRFYAAEVVLALEYLHKRNIVYRDLKPENILIQNGGHIMLTDFDLSLNLTDRKVTRSPSIKVSSSFGRTSTPRKLEKKSSWKMNNVKAFFACGSPMAMTRRPVSSSQKKTLKSRVTPEELYSARRGALAAKGGPAHSFVGTEEYVAPEIVWSRGHGLPVDWWTLGILLYELYYGKTPFKGANRKETFYQILCKPVEYPGPPSPLTDLIRKLLVKEADYRLGTKGGAEDIKKHPFFNGVNWDVKELQLMSTTPVVPEPFSWEQIEMEKAAKVQEAGKVPAAKWSFSSSNLKVEDPAKIPKSPSGPFSLKTNDSSDQEGSTNSFLSTHFVEADSEVSTPRDWRAGSDQQDDVEDSSEILSSDIIDVRDSRLPSFNEVRLEGVFMSTGQELFEDVF